MHITAPGLSQYFGGSCEIVCEATTPSELLQSLSNQYPQFAVAIMEGSLGDLVVHADGKLITEAELWLPLSEDTEVVIEVIPSGQYAAAGGAISSATSGMISSAAATIIVQAVATVAISYAVSAVMNLMFGSSEQAKSSVSSSAVYTWEGIQNTTSSGTPLQLAYGEHRVGGQVINLFTSYTSSTRTYLYAQYGLSEGEVASISDVYINGSPMYHYADVVAYTDRVGSDMQEIMPDFQASQSTQTYSYKTLRLASAPTAVQVHSAAAPVYGYLTETTSLNKGYSPGYFVYSP